MATKIISVQDRQAAGAGDDIQVQAGSGSGAFGGGSVILQGGLQGSSGGDGKVIVRLRSNQTGNLQEWQTAASGTLVSIDPSGRLALGPSATGAGNTNELRFLELAANGTNYVGFKAPDNITTNQVWTLPAVDGTSGQYLGTNGAGTLSWNSIAAGGTVTSVALSLPDVFSVTGSPVQSSGTLTATLAAQNPNLVFAGPSGGAADTPSFRALAAADLPTITSLGTVTAGTWNAAAVDVAYGGTGQTTAADAFNALSPITALGDIIYGSGANAAARLPGNTTATKQFLSQTGDGFASAAPAWSNLSGADVGLGSVENTALSTWSGSSNLTTLGTVGTGTWNATTIGTSKGGTGLTSIGTANQVLGVNSGATGLEYKTVTAGSNISVTHAANSVTIAASGVVTSVGLSLPAIFSVSGSPVQSSGTLTGSLANQNPNLVFAGPSGGAATTPSFRSLVASDLPTITSLGTVTTGTWNATPITPTYGGTGLTSIGNSNSLLGTNNLTTGLEWKTLVPGGNISIVHGQNTITLTPTATVTSVGLSLPSIFTVSNSPVTSSGTLTGTLATQSANLVFSGPTTGVSATPTFRSLVAADLPTITSLGTVTTGTWNASIIGLAYGGTNANLTAVNGGVAYSTASALALTAAGTANQVLVSNGAAAPTWASGLTLNAQQALLLNPYGTSAGNTSELRFAELAANGSHYVAFKSADSVASSLTWTLPNADGANGQVLTTNGSGTLSWAARDYPAQGRLTLTSGVPVTYGDVTAATILYYTPYVGDQIALYNGTTWSILTFSQVSLTLSTIPFGFSGTKPYDIFGYLSSGSLAIEGLAWTSEQVRATAIVPQNGVLVKQGDATRRYLGTIFPSTTNQTEDSAAKRYVWNMYNRVQKHLVKQDSTATWTYGTAAVQRMQNASTANRIDVVCGVIQGILVTHHCDVSVASAATPNITIYYNTSAPSSATTNLGSQIAAGRRGLNANMLSVIHNIGISSSVYCSPGFTCFNALEGINTAATVTFYGAGAQGIYGIWLC